MSRIKIDLPEKFFFSTTIPVRITDVNYGNHVGNDAVLSIIHEARMQFLGSFGYTELNFDGVGMVMKDVGIEFRAELFYGDIVIASVASAGFTKVSFDLYYKLEKEIAGQLKTVAIAKSAMVCYDYSLKKIVALPGRALEKLKSEN
jgi:acyl-CoA thioesterase FadM